MLASDARQSSDSSTPHSADVVAVQSPEPFEQALVRNCSRLGRSANPPGFSFSDWLRDRRGR